MKSLASFLLALGLLQARAGDKAPAQITPVETSPDFAAKVESFGRMSTEEVQAYQTGVMRQLADLSILRKGYQHILSRFAC